VDIWGVATWPYTIKPGPGVKPVRGQRIGGSARSHGVCP
jgi:hypothetical protein